ncbi:MAG: DUF6485 family protein [Acidobacteriota bacterium]|nr:DUF6485 family protein [Acidobacteriota bacterium]
MRACTAESNRSRCNCTYEPCPRKNLCCECLAFHWDQRELPACFFPDAVEKTYDRSLARFRRVCQDEA